MPPPRHRLDWYQDNETLSIVVYATNVNPEDLTVKWDSSHLSINYTLLEPRDPDSTTQTVQPLNIQLFAPITEDGNISSGYKLECSEKKFELRFKKQTSGWWPTLEASNITTQKPCSFSKIDETILTDDSTEQTNSNAEEKFLQMLKEIYAKGDDDTKRAMMKSFSSSGGSALSTNWDKVKDDVFE
ncbi:SGT1 Git7 [Babesia ovis]|uniref:SGT1 Git7 n=1 Tax=Babesia ovis TaxID=5869 RepID=A0A9W5WVA6_BABOV|nr:SGT1 Git7 [Babesia ovis]